MPQSGSWTDAVTKDDAKKKALIFVCSTRRMDMHNQERYVVQVMHIGFAEGGGTTGEVQHINCSDSVALIAKLRAEAYKRGVDFEHDRD